MTKIPVPDVSLFVKVMGPGCPAGVGVTTTGGSLHFGMQRRQLNNIKARVERAMRRMVP